MNVYRELNFGSSHKDQPQLKHAIFRKIAKTRYLKKNKLIYKLNSIYWSDSHSIFLTLYLAMKLVFPTISRI